MKHRIARINGRILKPGDKLTPHPDTEAASLSPVWHFLRALHVDSEGMSGVIAVSPRGSTNEHTFRASVFGVTVAFEVVPSA